MIVLVLVRGGPRDTQLVRELIHLLTGLFLHFTYIHNLLDVIFIPVFVTRCAPRATLTSFTSVSICRCLILLA